MFKAFLPLALPLMIIGIIASGTTDGAGTVIPVLIVGTVIYVLSHSAKGFERADRRRNRY